MARIGAQKRHRAPRLPLTAYPAALNAAKVVRANKAFKLNRIGWAVDTPSSGPSIVRIFRAASTETSEVLRVPRSHVEVADALGEHRAVLEEGGVFPPELLDAWIERLRAN